jgi:hypothetical protein
MHNTQGMHVHQRFSYLIQRRHRVAQLLKSNLRSNSVILISLEQVASMALHISTCHSLALWGQVFGMARVDSSTPA